MCSMEWLPGKFQFTYPALLYFWDCREKTALNMYKNNGVYILPVHCDVFFILKIHTFNFATTYSKVCWCLTFLKYPTIPWINHIHVQSSHHGMELMHNLESWYKTNVCRHTITSPYSPLSNQFSERYSLNGINRYI